MRAFGCLDWHAGQAQRTILGRRVCRWRCLFQPVHLLDHNEDREGDDDEVQDIVQEQPNIDRGGPGFLGQRQGGIGLAGQIDKDFAEIHAAQQHAQRRHNNILHQGGNDLAERIAIRPFPATRCAPELPCAPSR